MPDRWLTITHPDGRAYEVLPETFDRLRDVQYEGFTATYKDTGEPYEPAADLFTDPQAEVDAANTEGEPA